MAVARPRLATSNGPIWFPVDADGPVESELAASVAAVDGVAVELLDELGLTPEALVTVGFSQGGALALATLLDPSVAAPPSAVGVLAGYLPHRTTGLELGRSGGLPVLLAHGRDDETIDPIRGRAAAKALGRSGALVTWVDVDGGHRLRAPLVEPLVDWLAALAAGERPGAVAD